MYSLYTHSISGLFRLLPHSALRSVEFSLRWKRLQRIGRRQLGHRVCTGRRRSAFVSLPQPLHSLSHCDPLLTRLAQLMSSGAHLAHFHVRSCVDVHAKLAPICCYRRARPTWPPGPDHVWVFFLRQLIPRLPQLPGARRLSDLPNHVNSHAVCFDANR